MGTWGRFFLLVVAIALTHSYSLQAQQIRCATDVVEKQALLRDPQLRTNFELWMKKKLAEQKSNKTNAVAKTASTYQIPVVVHIIHNGEAIGTGLNIPDAQVLSQMRVLNEDWQGLNADAGNTLPQFKPVASSIDIQFILANQDPDGLPTTGITRTKGTKAGYTQAEEAQVKSLSYWPAEDYLNIWVINFTDSYLGYSQYPQSNLPGMPATNDRLLDGVMVHYQAFGSVADGAFALSTKYNRGRTTSHEVGHFLGLLHVFGTASSCSTTDYVDDTPVQKDPTYSCPTGSYQGCGHDVMYQNFMDYTDDACMSLFTAGQMARVMVVLGNSPRRVSLLSSHGLQDPVQYNLDLEAKNVEAPFAVTCGQSITPRVVVRNRGTTKVTAAKISLVINGNTLETKDFVLNLNNLDVTTLSFSTINLPEPSSNNVSFNIIEVNGTSDDDNGNNTASITSQVNTRLNPPFTEPFNSTPSNWQIINTDGGVTWSNVVAPKANNSNKAMYMNFYDYQRLAEKDLLISPYINITDNGALLRFDHAYAMFQSITTESLRVLATSGCSTNISEAVEIYKKTGPALATTGSLTTPFTPAGENQWVTDGVSLSSFVGKTIQLIFEATNQNGNNLYLDNVRVSVGDVSDVKVVSINSPGPVFCDPKTKPVISVQNLGSQVVNSLSIITQVNGTTTATETKTGLALTPGAMTDITLSALNLTQSTFSLTVSISDPAALTGDDLPADNTLTVTKVYSTVKDQTPIRQNFDDNSTPWTIYSDGTQKKWEITNTSSYQKSLVYKSYSNAAIGDQSWFISPVLDLTNTNQGSLFFSSSYGYRLGGSENLKVLVSQDCGVTYNQVIFDKDGEALSDKNSAVEWTPKDTTEWTQNYLSLNDFAGKDNIRVAFVATNDNGNNIFLDNIEFFVADRRDQPVTSELFAVYNSEENPYAFKITFTLAEKQDARLLVYNTLGQVLIDSQLPGTLNQTYTVDLSGQSSGVYIARLQTASKTDAVKLFLGK